MTKMNKFKFALLAASSMLVSGTASAQVVDAWTAGDIAITTENSDGATVALGSYDLPAVTDSATITGGTRNSVGASAVGASGSVSLNNSASFDGSVTGTVGAVAVEVTNGAASDVSNIGAVTGATISDGVQNGISRSAVGSSASTSVSILADGGAITDATYTVGAVELTSGNAGSVTVGVELGTAGDAAAGPSITGGTNNSISATALGASGSMSVATSVLEGASVATTVTVGDVTITSENSSADAAILLASSVDGETAGGIFGASIDGGVGNSISANAIGSSASFNYSNTLAIGEGSTIGTVDTVGAVTLTSTNASAVSNLTDIGVSGSTSDAASISGATNSSVGVAGIGASASLSYGSSDLTAGSGSTTNDVQVGASTIGATNAGAVTVASNIFNPTITGGYGNSVSMAAVGASASQTFNNFAR